MVKAFFAKDTEFDGVFVAGVKTTGIFCRPVCGARKPKEENVEFFTGPREALLHGYRPCKVCRPMETGGTPPEWLKPLLDILERSPGDRITDQDIREMGLEPNRVRRWFKEHHSMTFQAHQRLIRLGYAFGRIRQGETVTGTAFNSGYESVSGFADAFSRQTGKPPKDARSGRIILVTRVPTPLGPMLTGVYDGKLCLLEFMDRRMLETQLDILSSRTRASIFPGEDPLFKQVKRELEEYFAGERRSFSVPLYCPGTGFQKKVWEVLMDIPYGTTRSYGEQAKILGNPKAVRAVARANGENRIAVIIPCHRVIGADGKLVGYGGGVWRKNALLALERGERCFTFPDGGE